MKIYVAGKTDDWPRVRTVQDLCKKLSHTITYDWTRVVEQIGPDACTTGKVDEEFRNQCAIDDLAGTEDCDLLIMLAYPGLCGTLIECGMALGQGKPVICIGEPERNSVFFALDQVIMADEDCARDLGNLDAAIAAARELIYKPGYVG